MSKSSHALANAEKQAGRATEAIGIIEKMAQVARDLADMAFAFKDAASLAKAEEMEIEILNLLRRAKKHEQKTSRALDLARAWRDPEFQELVRFDWDKLSDEEKDKRLAQFTLNRQKSTLPEVRRRATETRRLNASAETDKDESSDEGKLPQS